MGMQQALLLCSLVMLFGAGVRGQTEAPVYPGDYIILAPNTVHPGLSLTLSVNILKQDAGAVMVEANILKMGITPTTVSSNSMNFNGGTSGVLTLQMPSDATDGTYQLQVSGSGPGLRFDETQGLTFKSEGFAILVQSDKAIYKPGQTIMFRAMAVYPDLKPYTGMFDVEMKDPDGNVVKQWMDLQNTEYGIVSGEMFTSDEARLGEWIIKVSANEQEYEHVVEVSEYVLPKFEVKLILPPFATSRDTEISGMVEAKYTYGQPVKGIATITVRYEPEYYYMQEEEPVTITRSNVKVDGTGDLRLTMKEIEKVFGINLNEIYSQDKIIFEAEVTESLTGIKQEGSGSVGVSRYPIKITEVTGNPEDFKPALPYTAYVSVTHLDDSPLTEEERLRGIVVRVVKDNVWEKKTDTIHNIPENGIVKFEIVPAEGAQSYDITVFYRDYGPDDTNRYSSCDGCLTKTIRASESPTDTFMQITTESNSLIAGDTAAFNILTTEVPGTLKYQVVSRGDIVHSDSIIADSTKTQLEFTVTSEMAPSPRLIVFYVRTTDGEVILASINFKVDGVFENDVTISAAMDKVEPGQDVSLDITAAANSFVGILAIDQSVRLLRTGNDITQDQVLQELDKFDTTTNDRDFGIQFKRRRRSATNERSKRSIWCRWCWFPIGGTTVKDVINNAGMLVFTNGLVYGGEDGVWPPYYYDIQFRGDAEAGFGLDLGDIADEASAGGEPEESNESTGTRIRKEFPETWLWADFVAEYFIQYKNPVKAAGAGAAANAVVQEADRDGQPEKTRIRTEFPETWLWSDNVADSSGNLRVTSKAPDTITSWVASAFGMSKMEGIGVADPTAKIQVFKNFFISLNLPYSVVRGELLALQVTVFNYMANDVTADITLVKSDGFDNIKVEKLVGDKDNNVGKEENAVTYSYESKDQVISAKIPANDGVTLSFPVKPKKLGMVDLTVKAESTMAADAITQPLLVKPEGVELSYSKPVFIDLAEENPVTIQFMFDLPSREDGLVDGSVRGVLTATGDIMGPTIAGLDKLLQMPTGCGEQNMIYFAPDVFIYKYLESTNQDNAAIKEKAKKFMEIGHSRELEYQHNDPPNTGAFSAFGDGDESGSTWLSAFVIKSFVQAAPYIYINFPKVEQSLTWVLAQQNTDGSFSEPGRVIHSDMQGNVNSELTMTAYVLISLQEVLRNGQVSQDDMNSVQGASDKAQTYLESHKNDIMSDTYVLALGTYALTMANSNIKNELKIALDNKAKGDGGVKYWSDSDGTTPVNDEPVAYYYHGPRSADVEMTGYALLMYLERGTQQDFAEAAGIAKWLTQQRNAYGGYSSTQDTVIGLQALSEYASQLNAGTRDITISISASDSADDTQELTINEDNSIVYQQVELMATSGTVTAEVSGTGNCLVQFNVNYNVNKENLVNNYDFDIRVTDQNRNRVDVKLCGRYVGEKESPGMGIMNMGVFSGFEAIEDELKNTVSQSVNIARAESNAQGVTFYMNDVGTSTCATVMLQRTKPVANTQPVQASLYRYYTPDSKMTQIFDSETLSKTGVCEVCGSNCNNCSDIPLDGGAVNASTSAVTVNDISPAAGAADDQVTQIFTSETLSKTDVCEVCGKKCANCSDIPPGGAAVRVINGGLVLLLTALTLIIHIFA